MCLDRGAALRAAPWSAIVVGAGFVGQLGACLGGDDRGSIAGAADASADDTSTVVRRDATADAGASALLDAASAADNDVVFPAVAAIRVANWSPGAPAVDFCLAPHGSATFRGPVLAGLLAQQMEAGATSDAGLAALPFPQVSAYFYVAPSAYDARLVPAGASNCSAGIGGDATTLPELHANELATIALVGEAQATDSAPGMQLVGFRDDAASAKGALAVRFINAAPRVPRIDLGTRTAADGPFAALFYGVRFGHADTSLDAQPPDASSSDASASDASASDASAPAPMVDSNGYRSVPPWTDMIVAGHPPGASEDTTSAPSVSAAAQSVLTFVLLGSSPVDSPSDAGEAGAGHGTTSLLECVDNAGTVGLLSSCSIISK
jgi:uncharacterized protein DUF4397